MFEYRTLYLQYSLLIIVCVLETFMEKYATFFLSFDLDLDPTHSSFAEEPQIEVRREIEVEAPRGTIEITTGGTSCASPSVAHLLPWCFIFSGCHSDFFNEQECIPVGCVPPAH